MTHTAKPAIAELEQQQRGSSENGRFDVLWLRYAEWASVFGGALLLASIVAAVNARFGFQAAMFAGLKQALWTALMAGLLTRLCRYLCLQTRLNLLPPMLCATLGPSALAILGVSVLHYLKGTADPLASVLVTVALAPPGFWLIAHNVRRTTDTASR